MNLTKILDCGASNDPIRNLQETLQNGKYLQIVFDMELGIEKIENYYIKSKIKEQLNFKKGKEFDDIYSKKIYYTNA